MVIESTINGIFQTPIYMSKLDKELTKKEFNRANTLGTTNNML